MLWWILASLLTSRKRLEAENLALRHQVTVLRRSAPQRLRLRGWDGFLFVCAPSAPIGQIEVIA